MPYGVSKDDGGDSPKNEARMERQVKGIQKAGYGKVAAIKMAKASLHRSKMNDKGFSNHFRKISNGEK